MTPSITSSNLINSRRQSLDFLYCDYTITVVSSVSWALTSLLCCIAMFRKLKDYKNTQPLIVLECSVQLPRSQPETVQPIKEQLGIALPARDQATSPEPLPETGVLTNPIAREMTPTQKHETRTTSRHHYIATCEAFNIRCNYHFSGFF